MLHDLYVILDAFKLLLKETLLLSNRLDLESVSKQCVHMLLIIHGLRTLVSVKVLMSISNWRHIILS